MTFLNHFFDLDTKMIYIYLLSLEVFRKIGADSLYIAYYHKRTMNWKKFFFIKIYSKIIPILEDDLFKEQILEIDGAENCLWKSPTLRYCYIILLYKNF